LKNKKELNKATNSNYADGISGGLFGNILGINAKLSKELDEALPKIAPAFLYLFIPGGRWQGAPNSQDFYHDPSIGLPQIVRSKIDAAVTCFWDMRGQIDNISGWDLANKFEIQLTESLGMNPKEFWSRWFGRTVVQGDMFWSNLDGHVAGASNPDEEDNDGIFQTVISAIPGVSLLSSLLPSLQFRPPLNSFAPSMSDWAGTSYPKDKTLIVGTTRPSTGNGNTGGTLNTLQGQQQSQNLKIGLGLGAAALAFLR